MQSDTRLDDRFPKAYNVCCAGSNWDHLERPYGVEWGRIRVRIRPMPLGVSVSAYRSTSWIMAPG